MKQLLRCQFPSNLLFFDTETTGTNVPEKRQVSRQAFWFGVALAFRYVDGKKTRQKECNFTTIDEFWAFLKSRASPDRPLYCFAHNITFDLTILDFWLRADELGFKTNYAILEDLPTMIELTWEGSTICFVDTLNYWLNSLADLGLSFGLPKLPMPAKSEPQSVWDTYCYRDVEILAVAVTGLIDYLKDNDLGPFAVTKAAISAKVYRHRFMTHEIYIHDNKHVIDLERNAYYGGLVCNYFIGKVKNKTIYHVDVNSLYPAMMLKQYPTKLIRHEKSITPWTLARYMVHDGAAAFVEIQTDFNTYPYRGGNKLLEVVGKFDTYLCGDELQMALARGHVKKVHFASFYDLEPIFYDFVEFFWAERQRYKEQNDQVKQVFVKFLMNSLYGKFGQRGYDWIELNPTTIKELYAKHELKPPPAYLKDGFQPAILWKQQKWFAYGLPDPISVRSLGGKIEVQVVRGEHWESCPIIAAYVTSYAREYLRSLIAVVGPNQVYYCDTDSLFVTEKGYRKLDRAGEIDATSLGKLKLEGEYPGAEFHGPKDYAIGGKSTIKGIRKDAICIGEGEYMQNQFEGLKSVLRREPKPYIDVEWITKINRRIYTKGKVSKSGWVKPFHLPDDLNLL